MEFLGTDYIGLIKEIAIFVKIVETSEDDDKEKIKLTALVIVRYSNVIVTSKECSKLFLKLF